MSAAKDDNLRAGEVGLGGTDTQHNLQDELYFYDNESIIDDASRGAFGVLVRKEDFHKVLRKIQKTVYKVGNWESMVAFMEAFMGLYGREEKMEFGDKEAKLNDRALQVLSQRMAARPSVFPTQYLMGNNTVGDVGAKAIADALVRIGVNLRLEQGLGGRANNEEENDEEDSEDISGNEEEKKGAEGEDGEEIEKHLEITAESFKIGKLQKEDFTCSTAGGVSINDEKKAKWVQKLLVGAEDDEERHQIVENLCKIASPNVAHTCRRNKCRVIGINDEDIGGFVNANYGKSTFLTLHSGKHVAYDIDLGNNNITNDGVRDLLLACWGGRTHSLDSGDDVFHSGDAPIAALDLSNQTETLDEESFKNLGSLARSALYESEKEKEKKGGDREAKGVKGQLEKLHLVQDWGIGAEDKVVPFFGKESRTWKEDGAKARGNIEDGGRLLNHDDVSLISAILSNHRSATMLDISGHELRSDSLELLSRYILNRCNNTIEVLDLAYNDWRAGPQSAEKEEVRLDEERSDELITASLVTYTARTRTSVQDARPP